MSPSTRWTTPLTLTFVGLAVALLAACGGDSGDSSTSTEPETIEVPTRWAYGNAATLTSLVQTSDQIFLGRVTRVIGQTEADQPPGTNNGRQAVPLTSFGVVVTHSVTGPAASGATVIIEQAGVAYLALDGMVTTVVLEGDKLLDVGASYLFFADRKPNGHFTVPPFGRLQVAADGTLQPLAAWSELGALRQLNGLSPAAAAARLVAPE